MKNKRFVTNLLCPERISWTLLLLLTAVLFFRPVEISDIWWHLKAGEYIAQHKVVPLVDPFPVQGEKTLWVLTQWLGSLMYYLTYEAGGLLGLKILRVLIILAALWPLKRFCDRGGCHPLVPWLSFLLIMAVATRPHLRPFLFNLLYIQLVLGALLHFSRSGRVAALVPVVLVAPLWVNTHMGSFVYGFTLIGVFLLAAAVEAATAKQSLRSAGILAGLAVLFAAAFMANPYGVHGALHPLRTLFVPGYLNFGLIKSSISELQPPSLLAWRYLWFYPTLLLGAVAVYAGGRHRFRNLILLACGLFMFLYGQRAALFFALISLYLFADSVDKERIGKVLGRAPARWAVNGVLWVGIVIIGVQHYQQKVFWQGRIYRQLAMGEAPGTPGPLLEDLRWKEVRGVIFNDDAYGGYMLWHTYPELRPFIDTRQINVYHFQLYNLVLSDPDRYWLHVDLQYRFQAVLLSADKAVNWKLIRYLESRPEWDMTAVHGHQLVFRRDRHKKLNDYEMELARHDDKISAYRNELQGIVAAGPQHRVRYTAMEPADTAITLFEMGYPGAALERLLYSFRISNSPYQHRIARLILKYL